jgi:hypothetical protein
MKITFVRIGALALAAALASLAALHGRLRRSTVNDSGQFDAGGRNGVIAYDSLVFTDQWLGEVTGR